jgi:formylglycine-generating enzyme required for sulfatase activity
MIEVADRDQNTHRKARIFISYSRKDIAFADQLEAALKARGFEPLIDRQDPIALQDWSKGIAPFENWWKRIETLIEKADTIVFVLSPDAVASKVALEEIDYAASLNKRFAPVVCRKLDDTVVPEALRSLHYINFDDTSRFDASADHLAAALRVDLDWVRKHSEFGETARRWATAGRPGPQGLLLRSPTLEDAERWIASRPQSAPAPTEETVAFVAASRRAAIWRRRRAIALASAFFLAMLTGLVAWWNQAWLAERLYAWQNVHALTAAQEQALKPGTSFNECTDCPDMIIVPAGSFMMGSPATEPGRDSNEGPQHAVTIAKPFAVAKFELTFAEWDACVARSGCGGYPPSDEGWGRSRRPVINVSWDDAQQYVAWLAKLTGKPYRLLTEAEYEYATRAGTTTAYPWGEAIGKNNANCLSCGSQWAGKQTAPIGSFPPNKFGLYDMVGNVEELTEDCHHDSYNLAPTDGSAWLANNGGECSTRVLRGGPWSDYPQVDRSAHRSWLGTPGRSGRLDSIGFRVGRMLGRDTPTRPKVKSPPDEYPHLADCLTALLQASVVIGSLEKQMKYQWTIEVCTEAIQANPQSASAFFTRGAAYKEMGHRSEAIADFRKVLAIDPSYALAKMELDNLEKKPAQGRRQN